MTLWWYVRNRKLVEDVDSKEYLPAPIKNTPRMIRGVFLMEDISALFLSWNARWYTPE